MEADDQFMSLNSSWNLDIMPVQKEDEVDSLSETSKSTSNDSEDFGVIEDNPMEDIHEEETGESPPRETVSATNTENKEVVPAHDELVGPSSQDDIDEEKPLEHDLGIGDKTSEDLGDDCDEKEKEEGDEKRAAKRPRLSSTDEVEEMEK